MVRGAITTGALFGWAVLLSSLQAASSPQANGPDSRAARYADEPERESLRYAGKSFQQWRKELQTELKPELRIEAIKAIGYFGSAGYASEAGRLILESMRSCAVMFSARNPQEFPEDFALVQAAYRAICRLGPETVPVVRAGLVHPHPGVRRFALSCIPSMQGSAAYLAPGIVRAIDDRDPLVRQQACKLAAVCCPEEKGLVSGLAVALRARDETTRVQAAEALGMLGARARPAVSTLIERLHDRSSTVRASAWSALALIDPEPEVIVRPLLRMMRSETDSRVQQGAIRYLLTQAAANANRLFAVLVSLVAEDEEWRQPVSDALRAMGPATVMALPALKEALNQSTPECRRRLEGTIRALESGLVEPASVSPLSLSPARTLPPLPARPVPPPGGLFPAGGY